MKPFRKHIDRRLIVRLRLYCITCLVMFGIIVIDAHRHMIGIGLAIGGTLIGIVIGIAVSRIYHLSWDEHTTKIIAQIDWIGGAILLLYLAFMVCRDRIFAHWIQASTLAAFGLCISAGLMLGRVIGARHGIMKTLQALGILKPSIESSKIGQ